LLAAAAGYLLTGVAEVRPEERAVVRRFGRVVARPGPGLWVGLPWGVDRVDRVAVRTARQLAVGYDPDAGDDAPGTPVGQLLTGDENLVNVRLVVEYAVDEAELDDYLAQRDSSDAVLGREAEAAAAEWVAGRGVDEVLLAGRAELPRWLMGRLPGRLGPHRLGLAVQRVSVDHLTAPAEVRDAFERVNQAQAGMQTQENQARQAAAQRRREADAVRFRLDQQAEAYRRERAGLATADATAFLQRLEQYRRLRATNPDVLAGIWWDETGRLLLGMKGRGRIDLLDSRLGPDGLDVTQFLPPKR
jgi:membrane protease subunit HflK